MMKKLKQLLYQLLVIDCTGCGALIVREKGLCLQCESEISRKFKTKSGLPIQIPNRPHLYHRSLFVWYPGMSDVLSNYIYFLKSPVAEFYWQKLAGDFILHHQITTASDLVIVPIPSSRNRKHSMYFALALAKNLQGKVYPALVAPVDSREQKEKRKAQRTEISFMFNEEFTEAIRQARTLVLVDDVITTGASYEAAYNVLKNMDVLPENIELWTAFHRQESGC